MSLEIRLADFAARTRVKFNQISAKISNAGIYPYFHGTNADAVRPTVPTGWIVEWIGSVVPNNIALNDKLNMPGAVSPYDRANHIGTQPVSTITGLTKSSVGLGNVDNTADAVKEVAQATNVLADSFPEVISGNDIFVHLNAFEGNPHAVTKTDVELGNVDNTSDAAKPVSTAQNTAIEAAKARSTHTGTQTISTLSDFPSGVRPVAHGATAGTARPTIPAGWIVMWIGSTVPTNAVEGDIHIGAA